MVVFSHILTKPTKVTGHVNPGSSQEGLCPLGGYMEGDSTPNLCVILQMMDSHFSPEIATTLDFSNSTTTSGDGRI